AGLGAGGAHRYSSWGLGGPRWHIGAEVRRGDDGIGGGVDHRHRADVQRSAAGVGYVAFSNDIDVAGFGAGGADGQPERNVSGAEGDGVKDAVGGGVDDQYGIYR